MNLCTNAAHAMEDDGGVLAVGLKNVQLEAGSLPPGRGLAPGRYLKISVSDTGSGIPPEVMDSIFEPYFTTKDVDQGTGMGLAVVHGIVAGCGGAITVDSTPGKGTEFTILIPTVEQTDGYSPPEDVEPSDGTERILFIDDENAVVRVARQILERSGYRVTAFTDEAEALGLFRANPNDFDLVITDMAMPHMTGDKVAAEMKQVRPNIPVILCTGYSQRISGKSAAQMGVSALAHKPLAKAELVKTVRNVLDDARASGN
jgi:CheY-like chemotaxis protein